MRLSKVCSASCRFLLIAAGFAAIALLAAAAGKTGSRDSGRTWDFAPIQKVPQKARARSNPMAGDAQAVAAGRKLYVDHCAECHGTAAEGGVKAPSLRALEVQDAAPGTLFWIVSNGVIRRGMPAWSKLPEPERWQIVSYLKSLPPDARGQDNAAGSGQPAR